MNDAVLLAQQLVRLDTAGNGETAAADVIAQRLEQLGVSCERYELGPGRDSLLARLPGRDRDAPGLCLTGHLDTCGVAYFTDDSRLAPATGDPPVAIVGPGDPTLAHLVDEWCSTVAIQRAAHLYEQIGVDWTSTGGTR